MVQAKIISSRDATPPQKIFLIVALGIALSCFVIVYLHDSRTVVLADATWYKILLFSMISMVGGYLFGSGTARK